MKKIWLRLTTVFSLLAGLGLLAAGCGSGTPCDLSCPTGQSCLIVDGNQQCVNDGDGNGCGDGQIGDTCENDFDCDCNLSCNDSTIGLPTCQP